MVGYQTFSPITRSTGGGQGYNTVGCLSDESIFMVCCLVHRDNIALSQLVETLQKRGFKR